jgi:hypothetical protein
VLTVNIVDLVWMKERSTPSNNNNLGLEGETSLDLK